MLNAGVFSGSCRFRVGSFRFYVVEQLYDVLLLLFMSKGFSTFLIIMNCQNWGTKKERKLKDFLWSCFVNSLKKNYSSISNFNLLFVKAHPWPKDTTDITQVLRWVASILWCEEIVVFMISSCKRDGTGYILTYLASWLSIRVW